MDMYLGYDDENCTVVKNVKCGEEIYPSPTHHTRILKIDNEGVKLSVIPIYSSLI